MEIKREYYLDKLIKRQNNGIIKVITGIRDVANLTCLILSFITTC